MIEIAKFNNEIFTEKEKQQDTEGNALLINEKYFKGEIRLVVLFDPKNKRSVL